MNHTLFEVSWEVCNKVGGIHTVLSTKAKTVLEKYGDEYVTLGPWQMQSGDVDDLPFEESAGFEDFADSCREAGVPVRVGRWLIPGRPRAILVQFSGLYEKKDGILAGLWERHQVNSLHGGWDYIEPVLFGHACGIVIEKWWEAHLAPFRGRAVAQFHEWMTASGMLYLNDRVPEVGTVFTTHATMLGRSVASTGQAPRDGLMGRDPADVAESVGVTAKHSLEGVAARSADVFTTVSEITADEAEVFHHRRADPILPNGIDLRVIDEIAGPVGRDEARSRIANFTSRFLAEDVSDAVFIAISGRYEFHNKGIDVFLDSLQKLSERKGRQVVGFVLVPAGNSGLRNELSERLAAKIENVESAWDRAIGISTHNLFDEAEDPVVKHCAKLGLDNARGSRVKIVQIPIYMSENDECLGLPYEAVLRAMDLSCFPSFYEPWGYTPEESLAVGVPTITSDYAGFGRWCRAGNIGTKDGVTVLSRVGVDTAEVVLGLEDVIESFVGGEHDSKELYDICRKTAERTSWSELIDRYTTAYEMALEMACDRTNSCEKRRRAVPVPKRTDDATFGPRLHRFDVAASLPEQLKGLTRLSENLWWSWDAEATALFEELSPQRWAATRHNPVRMLREIFPEDIERAMRPEFVSRLEAIVARFDAYMAAGVREDQNEKAPTRRNPVAYFSAEYALHESVRIYSGGLGVLAGDHLKSASDLRLPLIGIGLFYSDGYMRQRVTATGEQLSQVDRNDPQDLPIELIRNRDGDPILVSIGLPSSRVMLQAWRIQVGRVPLYLLDANLPQNRPEDREITQRLYGGDHEMRLRQEIVLGRAGVKLLGELGIDPSVWHCNEGHAAFLSLERVRRMIRDRHLTFEEAREVCASTTVFTTHTPVPAGHDRFGEDLMRRYFSDAPSWVGMPWEKFYELGQTKTDKGEFNMSYLAMRFANVVNGVSALHGEVSRALLHPFWPDHLVGEVPVEHVTNGVHLPTWTAPEIRSAVGDGITLVGKQFAAAADKLDDASLWDRHCKAKERLMSFMRERTEATFQRRGDSPSLAKRIQNSIDGNALWIGFARRFAPYKRAHLLFRDIDRLSRLVNDPDRPLRIVIAGKAHPADGRGQEILKTVFGVTRLDEFAGKILFLEDYDMDVGRHLVQGVDVWLNTPTRPLEASGTSGMKVSANGGLNLSIHDGWWAEGARHGENGWTIGGDRVYDDQAMQDELDSATLYELIENDVLPAFYDRSNGLPSRWIKMMKCALSTIPQFFDTDRMVSDYRDKAYEPLATCFFDLTRERYAGARSLAERHQRVRRAFGSLRVVEARVGDLRDLVQGDQIEVSVRVDLAELAPEEVSVEFVYGHAKDGANHARDLVNPQFVRLEPNGKGGFPEFIGTCVTERCGTFAYGIRVRARYTALEDRTLEDLILWA
ncbi:MAG: alpha-glucan family phosphorylase [Planctomycetes bacterium]|nr:alpha-glucan family phosphorylase [Planctomycetota bacterium]MCB9916806.1 alpha-glucan family phosphorylase [Planctomycetota bacterium]